MQTLLSRAYVYMMGTHSFFHSSNHSAVREIILNAGKCSITFSIGNQLNLGIVNKIAGLALRSSQRLHLHIGSIRMPLWEKELKPTLKVKNLLRTPIVIINKVRKILSLITKCLSSLFHRMVLDRVALTN